MTDEEMKEALDRAKTSVELTLFRSDGPSHNLYIISTALLASAAREQRMAKVVEAARGAAGLLYDLRMRFPPPDSWFADATMTSKVTMTVRQWNRMEALRKALVALDAPPGRGE